MNLPEFTEFYYSGKTDLNAAELACAEWAYYRQKNKLWLMKNWDSECHRLYNIVNSRVEEMVNTKGLVHG